MQPGRPDNPAEIGAAEVGEKRSYQKRYFKRSYLQTVIRRFKQHHLATVSLVILAVLVVAALLAPIIAPYNPDEIVGGFSKAPTAEHWLGTDQIGRDVLSRLLYATRISLLVGVLATAISTVIGVILGLIAGYFGGAADMIIMRFTDMVMSFPYILLVLVAASIFKPGALEHHPDSGLCRLAGNCPSGSRQCAEPAGE